MPYLHVICLVICVNPILYLLAEQCRWDVGLKDAASVKSPSVDVYIWHHAERKRHAELISFFDFNCS